MLSQQESNPVMLVCCFVLLTLVPVFVSADLSQPAIEWSTKITTSGDATPVAYPSANPNGVVVAVPGRVARLDGAGNVIFDVPIGSGKKQGAYGTYHFNASLADLNGDGQEEIIGGYYQSVFALDGNDGSPIWEYDLGTTLGMFHYAVVADLNGAKRPEILVPNRDGWMSCISADGKLLWRQQMESFQTSMAGVGDIDNDRELEIVYGTATHHLVALDAQGHLEWDTIVSPLNMWRTLPLIADANRDGIAEVYSMCANRSANSGLVAVNGANGDVLWQGAMTHKAYAALAAADIDQDGMQEILAGDKGTTLACFASNGVLRWRAFLGGHGIWTRPAVADINGDGAYEIIVTVRGASDDGYSWYVLDHYGHTLGRYKQEGGCFGAPLVADMDRDGVLEVVIGSRRAGRITTYSFGGPATENAILTSGWQGHKRPFHSAKVTHTPNPSPPPTIRFLKNPPDGRFGWNRFPVQLSSSTHRRALEVATEAPDHIHHLHVFPIKPGQSQVEADWLVTIPGRYRVDFRLLDLDTGQILGAQSFKKNVRNPATELERITTNTLQFLSDQIQTLRDKSPEAAVILDHRKSRVRGDLEILEKKIEKTSELNTVTRDTLATETDQFLTRLDVTHDYATLLASEVNAGHKPAFVLWQDPNPWDNTDPLTELPNHGGLSEISLWALGNEVESVAVNALNLSNHGITLRIEPGAITRKGENTAVPAQQFVHFHRVVRLPSRFGETVGDLLPNLADGYLLDVAPGEVQQIWMNIQTNGLQSGVYTFTWNVRTLDAASVTFPLTLHLEVSPVTLPKKSRYAANFWSQNHLGDINTIPDLNRIGQNVWCRIPAPRGRVDKNGELIGQIDWSTHDSILKKAKRIRMVLYGSPPTPAFPKGIQVTDSLRLKAQKNNAKAFVEHLRTLGIDYKHFSFYPQDEPGLTGDVDSYIERAKAIKAIDPSFQVYANPAGMITVDMIRRMEPYTDVWQPVLQTVVLLGRPYIQAMRGLKGDKTVWTYTAPGEVRILKPLGYYRAMAWQAFYYGIEGGGYWVYYSDDLWATTREKEPGFGAVAFDGRQLVTSRRWEATRDGIEDFNMLALLRDALKKHPDPTFQKLLNEAVGYMAETTLTDAWRQAVNYEPNFQKLEDYRVRLGRALEILSTK